jgi:prevent-host-death family protein
MADPVDELSVTEASRRGIARLVADAAHGTEVVVQRHGRPVAAIIGFERFTELEQLRDDLRDLALVIGRSVRRPDRPLGRPRRRDRARGVGRRRADRG